MQLASHGTRGATRNVSKILPHPPGGGRLIHISSFARVRLPPPTQGAARRLVTHGRTLLSKFLTHLTAPGLNTAGFGQSVHSSMPGRITPITQRFSSTARSRPLNSGFIPRAPTLVSRSVTQVGLGTARNFSSGRPLFQSLIENVPIAGRSFYEADWEIKAGAQREAKKKTARNGLANTGRKEMLKPNARKTVLQTVSAQGQASAETELDHYFNEPVTSRVTTSLLIPLAPTPSSRLPLPPDSMDNPLLPFSVLASLHNDHELHSLRVASLFSRLDAANVWERGVQCSAYAHRSGAEGMCTILKVEFVGWSKAAVRSVIGESGSGWCVLEETNDQTESEQDAGSDTSSILSGFIEEAASPDLEPVMEESATQSFVLPTLDFSSSFLETRSLSSPSLSGSSSGVDIHSVSDMDNGSDWESFSDGSESSSDIWVEPPSASANGWLGFSSSFTQKALAKREDASLEPRENTFY